ncbi:MAG: class I SAM-dependent methyltransferase [Alphaproteobacteria bacterium]|nr:class I SAM-dependent methyltransferase [Alphaproteobacteria bacterium]
MADPPASSIARHYADQPYPPRDPADERRRLITGSPSHLDEIVHYVRGGTPAGRGFRALIAGGGTGDAAIMLAQQLTDRGTDAEIVHLDVSEPSLAVAKARAAVRGLTNLRFEHGSLLDIDRSTIGIFDYIDCCGVLHHLPSTEAGLDALARVLRPDGGMGLMVYAPLGRTGVYPVQAALRTLIPRDTPMADQLAAARALYRDLPAAHWLKSNHFLSTSIDDDAALADLLLVPIDRAYDVPAFLDLIDGGGLRLASWIEPARYDPATYLRDPSLRTAASNLEPGGAAALAEQLAGSIKSHVAYAITASARGPAQLGPTMVPIVHRVERSALARSLETRPVVRANFDGHVVETPLPGWAAQAIAACDGTRSVAAIEESMPGCRLADIYQPLNALNLMLLRRAGA